MKLEILDLKNYDYIKNYLILCKANTVSLNISTTDKEALYMLGFLFAMGKKIHILNESDILKEVENYKIDLNKPSKSFNLMAYVWQRLGDIKFSEEVKNKVFNEVIDNYKRLGVTIKDYEEYSQDNNKKIFLISPVRNATDDQRNQIEEYKKICEEAGYKIHVPHLNTVQSDMLGGYTICHQNAKALAESEAIHIYYDKNSKGSMFDLGVAASLAKPLFILNERDITFDMNDFGDEILNSWQWGMYNEEKNNRHKKLLKK